MFSGELEVAMNGDAESCVLCVQAPSRLHFGLLSFGELQQRQFGGVGVMVRRPGVYLQFYAADRFSASGPLAARVGEAARRWSDFYRCALPACHIHVAEAPRQHSGLGVGTQLSLAVAWGLHAWQQQPRPAAAELARSVGRGQRSAIGVYGFCEGGLIAERGKLPGESLSPMDCRLELPAEWRFVLACPAGEAAGLSGSVEEQAFAALPAVPPQITSQLVEEVQMQMLPAAARGDFAAFSESVFRYGHQAGSCFAPVQGGAYHGPLVADLVQAIRAMGVRGVGQTSWGPTVFALTESQLAAERLVAQLQGCLPGSSVELVITNIAQHGAHISSSTHANGCRSAQQQSDSNERHERSQGL